MGSARNEFQFDLNHLVLPVNFALTNTDIVTNDEDFLNLLLKVGFPPKVVLQRMGNQSMDFVRDTLLRHTADIDYLEKSEDYGLLEIYG
jgi:predicted nuclease of predicted toxin-antitoxin system